MDRTWYLLRLEGRIYRAKMWLAALTILCSMTFLAGLALVIGIVSGERPFGFNVGDLFRIADPATYRTLAWVDLPFLPYEATATSLFLWVYFATSIKRLHDRDRSGWWMVPFFIIPGLFNQFTDGLPDSHFSLLPGLACFALGIWGFVEMYCLQGSGGTNRFGPDPLAPRDTGPRWEQQSEIEMVPHKARPPSVSGAR